MKKVILIGIFLIAGTLSWLAAVQKQQMVMAEKLLRLHVVANSDSEYDQEVKLQVRDAVLMVTEGLTDKKAVEEALPEIKLAAERRLAELECAQEVNVTLAYEEFPVRYYETFSLPAGVYPALRVTLGEGRGRNWWCVVFPTICLCASSEIEDTAVAAGFSEQEVNLITEDRYRFRFKTLELIQKLRVYLSDIF